jgi:hypothetical protein
VNHDIILSKLKYKFSVDGRLLKDMFFFGCTDFDCQNSKIWNNLSIFRAILMIL